jgi:hypothetical protein
MRVKLLTAKNAKKIRKDAKKNKGLFGTPRVKFAEMFFGFFAVKKSCPQR